MKKRILLFLFGLLLTGCMGEDYPDSEGVIDLICGVEWENKITYDNDGNSLQTVYKFKNNGTYKATLTETHKSGNTYSTGHTGLWSFTDKNCRTIHFGQKRYWDIDVLRKDRFAFYDRNGEYGELYMTRKYTVLVPHDGEIKN